MYDGEMVTGEFHSLDNPPPSCLAHKSGASCPAACECNFVHEIGVKIADDWSSARGKGI